MNQNPLIKLALAFLVAVAIATVGGAIVQTQFNLNALSGIDVDITAGQRLQTTFSDIFSGFTPTYGFYVVLPSLLVAFLVASVVVSLQPRLGPSGTLIWYALAGGLAILIGNPVVNYLAAVALLVGATRDFSCLVGMAVFGAVAGAVFACMRPPHRQIESREPRSRPVVHT